MPRPVRSRARLPFAWLLIFALAACLPSCATDRGAARKPGADDLDAARSDFDRHTPPGGD